MSPAHFAALRFAIPYFVAGLVLGALTDLAVRVAVGS